MKRFTSKGTLYIPVPQKVIKPPLIATIINECFCPAGHNLMSPKFSFDGHDGILLKVRDGKKAGHIALSPICGQKNRVDWGIHLTDNVQLIICCPICGAKLPVYSPCECGADLVALFLDRHLNFSNCIGVCNRTGCKHSIIILQNELSSCSGLDQW
jgi:hypothetical protein